MTNDNTTDRYRLRQKAPWPDYAGNDIHEGDTIRHPADGMEAVVVFDARQSHPADQWRADYGEEYLSRLCLQIGDKGQAVVSKGE